MLFIANWLVLFVFIYFSVKVWRQGNTRLTIICAVLWLVGRIISLYLGVGGVLMFIPHAALLCLILIYNYKFNKHIPQRKNLTAEEFLNDEASDQA